MNIEVENKRATVIKFVRTTVYRALSIVTLAILIGIFALQALTNYEYGHITALLTIIGAWIITFICEYNIFLIKNFSGENIDRLYRHIQGFISK